jgi:DnaJ-domain-containing protein 1
MTDTKQQDEFMKQYMSTCKEQIEKLAKDPELLNQTLRPFMQMSQQLMGSGLMGEATPNMIPDSSNMDINKMIAQMGGMIDYVKAKYKELVKQHNRHDDVIGDLDKYSRQLRSVVKKLIEKIEESNQ